MLRLLSLFAVLQQQPSTPPPALTVRVEPAEVAVEVGDTVRLRATAQDSAGRPVSDSRAISARAIPAKSPDSTIYGSPSARKKERRKSARP